VTPTLPSSDEGVNVDGSTTPPFQLRHIMHGQLLLGSHIERVQFHRQPEIRPT